MKKRVISLLLALVLALGLLPTAAWAAGTEEISTAEAFAQMRANGNYILTEDITVSTPYANDFSGTFDGAGHTITLKITGHNSGLFKKIGEKGTVKNVITEGSVGKTTNNTVGGIAASCDGTIEKCWNKATIQGKKVVGGIVGTTGTYKNGGATDIEAVITDCYNTGLITTAKSGMMNIGGIVGTSTNTALTNCVNMGNIDTTTTFRGGIAGASAARDEIMNCYWLDTSCKGGKTFGKSFQSTELETVAGKLGSNWTTEKGTLALNFGSTEPSVSVTASPASLQMVNSGARPTSTLTVKTENMGTAGATVEWSVEPEGIVELNDTGNEFQKIAAAVAPGTATIKATVKAQNGSEIESNTASIVVRPCFTTVEIKPVAPSVTVAAGQTVQAIVNVFHNTGSYAPAGDARLSYKWYWYHDSANKNPIEDETGRTCKIPTEFHDTTGSLYLYVEVYDDGRPAQNAAGETLSGYAPLLSGDDALLAFDKDALTLEKLGVSSTTITEDTTLNLPSEGENGSRITWESSDSSVIDPMTGKVTLPAEGEQKVTLTANLTLNDSTGKLPREFTIKSKAAQAVDADKETLEKAAKSLSTLHPRFGKDSNVQTMVETRLAKEFPDVGVMYTGKTPMSATENEAHSDISDNGNVTYFYTDLTTTDLTTTLQRFDTYKASFMLTCGRETKTVEIWVTVYWDADKVRDFMTKEVLDQTTLPELTEKNLTLPASGKWTTISWTSSDPTIIANDGTITRSTIDQQAVLTATFTFNFTSDVTGNEQPIVLYKVFEVTVKGNADAADRAALYQQKLNDALAAPGLKDFVTGAKLTADANGVYTTSNDIQFPTTRDLKIDGKYTPVVITSSDPGVIEAPTTPNSARVWVYRPLPGEAAKTVTLTMKILDRPNGPQPGDDLSTMRVLASKEIKVTVQPLTQAEIDAEIALMAKVKAAYWDGIRNANTDQNNVTTDLHAFQECYLNDNGELTWVYDRKDLKNHGIVPVPLDNWYDQQIWRLFRSSNADVVAHENLLVTRQGDSKAVTITSYLSSETLGRYAEKYPQNADFQKLYQQPVTVDLVVTGTQYAQGNNEGRVQAARRALAARPTVTVSFSLSGRGMGFAESNLKYAEGSTVYDVFSDLLAEHGYTCKRRGSYIAAITSDSGVTLEEFDEGKNSGWMYRVNGELVRRYMSAQGLKDGDRIELYFTSDWTSEPGAEGWQKPGKIETIVNADGSVTKIETKPDGTTVETTTKPDGSTTVAETKPDGSVSTVEKRADGTEIKTAQPVSGEITASVSVPKSVGSTRVDIPVSKPTGSMVAVIVHPDGTEEIVKGSIVTETGIALRAEGDVRLKIIDNAKRFNDMADHWAKDAVEFASSRELFNGVGNDAFGPDRSMTRGMVGTVLARLAGADTAGGETWYAKGTAWAVENGISDGTAPEQPVTREQLAAMLYRYAGSPAVSGELGFDDADSISAWARDAVRWCVDNGILNGVGGNRMTPQDLARRGQVAAMLMRFLQATV